MPAKNSAREVVVNFRKRDGTDSPPRLSNRKWTEMSQPRDAEEPCKKTLVQTMRSTSTRQNSVIVPNKESTARVEDPARKHSNELKK